MQFPIHARMVPGSRPGRIAPEPALPSKARMAANFATALVQEQVAKFRGIPEPGAEEQARRKAICDGCPHLRPSDGRCSKCGCWRDKKVAWRSQRCPLRKW